MEDRAARAAATPLERRRQLRRPSRRRHRPADAGDADGLEAGEPPEVRAGPGGRGTARERTPAQGQRLQRVGRAGEVVAVEGQERPAVVASCAESLQRLAQLGMRRGVLVERDARERGLPRLADARDARPPTPPGCAMIPPPAENIRSTLPTRR